MSATAGTTQKDTTYIRGVRAVEGDSRSVVRVLVALCLLALIGLTIALTVGAASQNSRLDTLRQKGVPVEATVTGCLGISSGIGMSVEYWQCRGTYALGGHQYNEVIGGSRALLQEGQSVQAVAVPGNPALLSSAASVTGRSSTWTPYVTPMILGAVTLISIAAVLLWSRRRRPHQTPTAAATPEVAGPHS